MPYRQFSEEEQREIVFKDITTGEVTHTTILDTAGVADYRSVIGYFAQTIMKDLRLVSGYDVLYGKVKAFVQDELFDRTVDLEHPNTLRNLSELAATKTLIETFKKAINALTVRDKGDAEIRDTIKLRQTRPFVAKDQGYLVPKKSVFNRIIGDSHLGASVRRLPGGLPGRGLLRQELSRGRISSWTTSTPTATSPTTTLISWSSCRTRRSSSSRPRARKTWTCR